MPVSELIGKGDRGVLKHAAVTMQQNDRWALAGVGIVQAYSINRDEVPDGRVLAFRSTSRPVHRCGHCRQRRRRAERDTGGKDGATAPAVVLTDVLEDVVRGVGISEWVFVSHDLPFLMIE
jgi:hypothetical protein